MANRLADVLHRYDTGAVIQPGDRDVIRQALRNQVEQEQPVVAFYLRDREWTIGQGEYRDLIGFEHIQKLLNGEQLQLHADENGRKAIQKSVHRAIAELISTQSTIGLHLKSHIQTGAICVYTGDWVWKLVP